MPFWYAITYFNRNIHLHVEFSVMAPPTIGPTHNETAYTIDMLLLYSAYLCEGTRSKMMTEHNAKSPEPPSPCKARKIMLIFESEFEISRMV